MSIDGERFAELLEILALSVLAANADSHLHEHALAAAPSSRMDGCVRDLSHATSLKINYTAQDENVEGNPGAGAQNGYWDS